MEKQEQGPQRQHQVGLALEILGSTVVLLRGVFITKDNHAG